MWAGIPESGSYTLNPPASSSKGALTAYTQFSPRTKWSNLLFVPFPRVNSSISKKLSYGATFPVQNAARFFFLPRGLLDRPNRENQNMKHKSRVQTWFNLTILARSKCDHLVRGLNCVGSTRIITETQQGESVSLWRGARLPTGLDVIL